MSENGQTGARRRDMNPGMELDADRCYRLLTARDARFDGVFFVAVSTTGVYCRPVCTARTPRRDRCSFFRTAAEAEKAGFRACFVCRPELAPGNAPVDAVSRLVAAAIARIEEGCLNEGSLEDLAAGLGVSSRHLRRAIEEELGVSPIALAQSRRLALAKQLLQDTRLPLVEVALASGFRSVRRFNATFAERFGRAPSALRRENAGADASAALVLRLDYRAPLDWEALLAFLRARAVPGVEEVNAIAWRRVLRIDRAIGVVEVTRDAARRTSLRARVAVSLAPALMRVVPRLRAIFDLDAAPAAIDAALGRDRRLAASVRRHPGLRVPGAPEPFEAAVRAVLGQQVSVRGATTLAGRLAERFGAPVKGAEDATLTRAFPDAPALARASADEIGAIGLPRARAASLRALAVAFARDGARASLETLRGVPGIGPWTLEYVAMRGFRAPDAFPASDLEVKRRLGSEAAALACAEAWRPWRAYALMHLWNGADGTASPATAKTQAKTERTTKRRTKENARWR